MTTSSPPPAPVTGRVTGQVAGQVAGQIASCVGCLAWGQVRRDGRCAPCADFAIRWPPTRCGACSRALPTKKGYCRLCWHQARLDRSARLGGAGGTYGLLLPDLRRVRHHQLFLAGAFVHRDVVGKPASRRHGAGSGTPGLARKPAPPAAVRPRVQWVQPGLFDTPPRVYRVGQVDLRSGPAPDNPWLSWALHLAHTRAETRGWTSAALRTLNRSLVMALAGHRDGEMIRVSDVAPVLRRRYNSVGHLLEILAVMDILLDDREPVFERWLHGKTTGLAPAIGDHTRRWAKALHDGGPRTRARSELTVRSRVDAALPALTDWSTRYDHLREISPEDVLTHLAATRAAERRHRTAAALRSLFSWAKPPAWCSPTPPAASRSPGRPRSSRSP